MGKSQCWDQPEAQQHTSARKGMGAKVRIPNRQEVQTKLDQTWKQMGLSLEINQKELGRACGQRSPVPKWWVAAHSTPQGWRSTNICGRGEGMPDGMDGLWSSREVRAWSNHGQQEAQPSSQLCVCSGAGWDSTSLLTPTAASSGQAEVVHTARAVP